MNIPSRYLERAVDEIGRLPGIGKKTALRLALHILDYDEQGVHGLTESLKQLKEKVKRCERCGNLSDKMLCEICSNPHRDAGLVCVVEDIRDVMAIENTGQYRGVYHVLGGVISPMEGIGPGELNINTLVARSKDGTVRELIFGLGTTMEGETTTFYLYKKLAEFDITLSSIARGISMGDQLEYADELTLARSINNRVPYESSLNQNG
jgi:recombination protein RecR